MCPSLRCVVGVGSSDATILLRSSISYYTQLEKPSTLSFDNHLQVLNAFRNGVNSMNSLQPTTSAYHTPAKRIEPRTDPVEIMSIKMSAGLMSCVRQNSPPLEMGGGEASAISLPPDTPETQKRRRFHPLRNLRRIFRRRTVAQADNLSPRSSIIDDSCGGGSSSSTTPTTSYSHHGSHGRLHVRSPGIDIVGTTTSASSDTLPTYPPHHHHHHHHQQLHHHHHRQPHREPRHSQHSSSHVLSQSVSAGGGLYAVTTATGATGTEKREHSADSARTTCCNKEVTSDLDRDMTDYQRSLSEGRLVDSEYSGDGLSQSHDSVFSESATASTLSIVLKAELADVLRKRRQRPDASDEDLGLPRSPITPQRQKNVDAINQSEGSLSLLSMASSELDEDESSGASVVAATGAPHPISASSSQDTSRNYSSDEVDLDASMLLSSLGSKLSHSAARHKMAVRPKKKGGGPSRHHRNKPIDGTPLPPTPEVNEESQRHSLNEATSTKLKSQSLPLGMNPKILDKHSLPSATAAKTSISTTTITAVVSTIVSPTTITSTTEPSAKLTKSMHSTTSTTLLSKSYETYEAPSNASTLERCKDEDGGFFRRLLNRSTKKKKTLSVDDTDTSNDRSAVVFGPAAQPPSPLLVTVTDPIVISSSKDTLQSDSMALTSLNTYLPTAAETPAGLANQKSDKPRSGPASRQRIVPQELSVSPVPNVTAVPDASVTIEKLPPKSPKKSPLDITPKSFSYTSLASQSKVPNKIVFNKSTDETPAESLVAPLATGKYVKAFQARHDDERFKKFSSDDLNATSTIKSLWPDDIKMRQSTSRVSGILSRIEPDLSAASFQSPRRKLVEKSKSFRFYNESSASNNNSNIDANLLQHSNNMPSLPDLSFTMRRQNAVAPIPLLLRPTTTIMRPPEMTRSRSREVVVSVTPTSVTTDNKFEINDNNLMIKSKDDVTATPHLPTNVYTKNIILPSSGKAATSTNQNITQIEDNIDKIMASAFVTVLKKATTNDFIEIKSRHNNVSVTSITSTGGGDGSSLSSPTETRDSLTDASSPSSSCSASPTTASRKPADVDTPTTPVSKLPEFMKIQLNRIDGTPAAATTARPKSVVVMSKSGGVTAALDSKERRFSNESVEITDSKPSAIVVVTAAAAAVKPNSLIKPADSVVSSPAPPATLVKKPGFGSTTTDIVAARVVNAINNTDVIVERRKSVSDEKIKFEKKIVELKEAERKRSLTNTPEATDTKPEPNRKSSLENDDNVVMVVLRKKSLSQSNTNSKDDTTPELMKVFARRSLKIKDTDDYQIYADDDTAVATAAIKTSKSLHHLDSSSDKENQSSSEEKLDKLTAGKTTEKVVAPGAGVVVTTATKHDDENAHKNGLANKKMTSMLAAATAPKPFAMPGQRFGSVVSNYRTTASFLDSRKPPASLSSTSSSTTSTMVGLAAVETNNNCPVLLLNSSNNNNSNNNNNNNTINSLSSNQRHTIGGGEKGSKSELISSNSSSMDTGRPRTDVAEFKGILQRRAEWEKRAKEAFK